MKTIFYKTLALSLASFIATSCAQETEAEVKPLAATESKKFGTIPGATIIDFSEANGYISEINVKKDSYTTLPVKIKATRFTTGKGALGNAALVYDTTKPDKKNAGYTAVNRGPFQLGNVLTVGEDHGSNATINDKGGSIEMDFSSFGSVVMRGLYIADIEEHEKGSTLELLDAAGTVIYSMVLPVTGAYTFQPLVLGPGVAGVAKLRVTFKSTTGRGGSGAIDVVQFCPGTVCYR
ncbi:hypothetical protein [Pontibacter populi]|uniref:DUF4382 domain-containing protein n=1 Tax=Pontibacter populi TaxID=890055 RepID=A0ABV1RQ13_9BACT